MIYLIGGPPRCGKTILARRLARVAGCSWVQGDWLSQAFSVYLSNSEILPVERLDLGPGVPPTQRNDARYARYSATEIIAYYRAWAVRTWPGLRVLIEYAIDDQEDLVVDGYHIDPALVGPYLSTLEAAQRDQIQAVFLHRVDQADILRALRHGEGNDWVRGRTQQELSFERIATMIAQYSREVCSDAEAAGLPVFAMDFAFDQQLDTVVALLTSRGS